MKITYLGTAAAEGFPGIFCHCEACEKARERGGRDIRTRSQALIDGELLIDFPPDSYLHSLRHKVDLSAARYLLFTHSHMDHMFPQEIVLRGGGFAYNMVSPDLHLYASPKTKERFDEIVRYEREPDIDAHLYWHTIAPFEENAIGEYRVTALPANHMPGGQAYNYFIEMQGKSLLYFHDTGWPDDSVIDYLKAHKKRPNLVSLDCTSGPRLEGPKGGHMGIPDNRDLKKRLLAEGICNEQTLFVINHFSHNGGLLYDELVEEVRGDAFEVAFDGKCLEF